MPPEDWEKKREVVRYYDELAPFYDSLYGDEQNLKAESALKHLDMRGSDVILDVGCGTGFLLEYVARDISFMVGVDMSLGLLKVALARAKAANLGSACLIRADADCLPFKKGVFDKVFAFTLLQNVPDSDITLGEMARVAKGDALFVVSGLKKAFSEQGFRNLLAEAGFSFTIIESPERSRDVVAVCRKRR